MKQRVVTKIAGETLIPILTAIIEESNEIKKHHPQVLRHDKFSAAHRIVSYLYEKQGDGWIKIIQG